MTNQDNLPVWAKILLGIAVNESTLPNHGEREEQDNSSQRKAQVSELAQTEQTVRVYNPNQRERKWSWKGGLCPTTREAN